MRYIGKLASVILTFFLMPVTICLSQAAIESDLRNVEQTLKSLRPDLPIKQVYRSPVPDIVAVDLEGGTTLYATTDAKYMFAGDLYSLNNGISNETDKRRDKVRREILSREPLVDMIIFSPSSGFRTFVNIFTDVDCGYCQKLHSQMDSYNALGIEVRYMAYPRAGLEGDTFEKTVSAWCSKDRRSAITALKKGQGIPEKSCDNPVGTHYWLGQRIGIKGTPAIITSSGQLLPGYLPPKQLASELGL